MVKLLLFKKPITEVEFNFIFTIVNRLTKKIRLVFFKKESSAEKLAYTFLKNVVALNGMPEKIITDKGPTLVFKFWTALTVQLEVNYKLLTAFYPQTDKQTKRIN